MSADALETVDAVRYFRDTTTREAFRNALSATAAQLKIAPSPGMTFHALMQFRLYADRFVADSAYLSVMSAGYFRTSICPIPLRQIGVKLAIEDMPDPRIREAYVAPINQRDFVEHFDNSAQVDLNLDLIGFGISLEDYRAIVEVYSWETRGTCVDESIENRDSLFTGERTPYYRHMPAGGRELSIPEAFEDIEAETLHLIAGELGTAIGEGDFDPTLIYSVKHPHDPARFASYYLTSAPISLGGFGA